MSLEELIISVGHDRFVAAQSYAWAHAAGTGTRRDDDPFSDEARLPSEMAHDIWERRSPYRRERIPLTFELYRVMPAYAVLMYPAAYYGDLTEGERDELWTSYRELLSHEDDRLADPVAYSLWCDYFESRNTVDEAWRELSPTALSPRGIERLLIHSGPVPYRLKASLYAHLLPNPRWHYFIFRSLLHSAFNLHGDLDKSVAQDLLYRLQLDPATEHLDKLRERLA